jgi:hypothetical protein
MGRNVSRIGEMIKAFKILVRKKERNRSLRKLWRRWVDNIKMDFRKGYYGRTGSGFIWLRIGTRGELLWRR